MRTLLLAALLAGASAPAAAQAAPPLLDTPAIATRAFGNDAPWYLANIPFLDTPDTRAPRRPTLNVPRR